MKRIREENLPGTQSKRLAVPSQAQPSATPQRLTTNDALAYLKAVKDIFKNNKGKYDEFLLVMKDFKAQRIDTAGVIRRVKELFKGHRDLILGFNTFLPEGYEITLPLEDEPAKKQPVEFDQAITYVNKIKTRFQQAEHIYKAFLEILNMYRKGNKSIKEVYTEIASLFREHPDLLEEFTHFLPDTSGVVLQKVPGNSQAHREDKGNTWFVSKQQQQDKREKDGKDQHKRDVKDAKDLDNIYSEDEQDSNGLPRFNTRKLGRRTDELIRKPCQSGERVEAGRAQPIDDKRLPRSLQKKLLFFDRVKTKLGDHDAYQELIKCLNMYTEEIITRTDLHKLVEDILGNYPDLMEGFREFLVFVEGTEDALINNKNGDGSTLKAKVDKDKEKERERAKDTVERRRDLERERNKDRYSSQVSNHKSSVLKDKYWAKPISELDLSNCERCTPSYRLLPKSYPKPASTFRKHAGLLVLNDKWVSVTSGSEDYSFKHMRKNQYEESLFRCEDDRFELDMLLETTAATIQRVEEYLQKMQESNCDGKQYMEIQMGDYLKEIHLRCIERIYGDHGLDVLDLLHKNASENLRVILNRLKQKQEEWLKCRNDMNKIWAEVYAKNYHKSLDHRSFYFKQQDKKSLSTKALLTEIKEISSKKQKDDNVIVAIASGNKKPCRPDLVFDYPDKLIYDDLYRIIKYSADEMCSSMEQSDKMMRLWTMFLEPFFGVPSRPQGTEDTEEVVKVKCSETKISRHNNIESNGNISSDRSTERKHESLKCNSSPTEDLPVSANKSETGKLPKVSSGFSCRGKIDNKGEKIGSGSQVDSVHAILERTERLDRQGNLSSQISSGGTLSQTNCGNLTSDMDGDIQANHMTKEVESKGGISSACGDVQVGSLNRLEREEGELSSSPEVDEKELKNTEMEKCVQSTFDARQSKDDEDMENDHEAHGGHDAYADDEDDNSAHKSGEDSQNGSEPGEDMSGSESGDGNDSPEEHEDDGLDEQQEGKNESEGEPEFVADAHDGDGSGSSLKPWDRLLQSCMPLAVHGPSSAKKGCNVFYGNDTLYVLFRLHQMLYERILCAKTNAKAAERKLKSSKDATSPDLYEKFMRGLYNLLDGSADNVKFEDDCRAIIGTQSYLLFTLDKLIYKLVKQLQAAASDELSYKLLALYTYEKSHFSVDLMDDVYYTNACVLLHDDNLYRFEHKTGQLTVQLMEERSSEKQELGANAMDHKFLKYLNSFLHAASDKRKDSRVFLARNKKFHHEDELTAFNKAMEGVVVSNGLDCNISCNTFKVAYILGTRDFLFRRKRERKLSGLSRRQRFNRWLSSVL